MTILLDWSAGGGVMSRDRIEIRGRRVPAVIRQGVPCIEIELDGDQHYAFFDTGAQLSYMPAAYVNGETPIGEREDFFPVLGRFIAPVYQREVTAGGIRRPMQFGVLPEPLRSMLAAAGIEWIVGNEMLHGVKVLLELGESRIVFC